MGNYLFAFAVCDIAVCLKRFVKALCYAGVANIQDYTPAFNDFGGNFLCTIYNYYGEKDAYTSTLCSADIF